MSFKIFGFMVVKNEADIVSHTLHAASAWCDAIYVLDNGSTDGTWELINRLASENPAIVVHGQSFEPFNESLRAKLFNAYRHLAKPGDWWCRLDADEIYVESPRDFLMRVRSCDVVWAIHLQYYFTDVDLRRYQENPALYDPSLPPAERLHYYKANASEGRFFRHRRRLRWEQGAWPRHLGRVCPDRILLCHYQYRSPEQIELRLKTRTEHYIRRNHGRNLDPIKAIADSDSLDYDAADGSFNVDEALLPSHRDPVWRAALKRIMHGTGVWP